MDSLLKNMLPRFPGSPSSSSQLQGRVIILCSLGLSVFGHRSTFSVHRQEGEVSPSGQPSLLPGSLCALPGVLAGLQVVPMLNSSFSVTTSALGRMVGGGHLVSG